MWKWHLCLVFHDFQHGYMQRLPLFEQVTETFNRWPQWLRSGL